MVMFGIHHWYEHASESGHQTHTWSASRRKILSTFRLELASIGRYKRSHSENPTLDPDDNFDPAGYGCVRTKAEY